MFAQEKIDQLKAAFLLNFAKYVEWPESSMEAMGENFTFCIVGEKEKITNYKVLENKSLNNKSILVELTTAASDSTKCQVVFLTDTKAHLLSEEILKLNQNKPVLIVSDTDEKGMIYLYEEEGRIKFNINLIHAQKAGLTFSSQMLKLANHVTN